MSTGLFGLADHGTELNKAQSDRLMMTSMGTTTSITQRAVAPSRMGAAAEEQFRSALDVPASKSTVAEKGYVVALGDWLAGDNEGKQIDIVTFPEALKKSDYAIFGMMNYHEFIRCGLDVTIQINPTEWQTGGIIAWIETCQDTAEAWTTNYNNLLTYTSGILNCNVNNEIRLKQAFTFSRNLYELHATSTQPDNLFVLRIAVWSKMRVATGTSTKVSYKVTASLCDVEMHGIRLRAQMNPDYGPTHVLHLGPGIGAVNTSNMQEMDVTAHMTMGCEGFVEDSTFAGGVECTSLEHHLRTPCRFATFLWSTTVIAGTQLAKWKVHPRQPHNTYSTWQGTGNASTNQALLSSLYRFWRGDLVFIFQVFASKWHSGRMMVAFTPGQAETVTSNTTLKQLSTCASAQFDIHGPQSTFAFRVPYMSSRQYMDCDPAHGYTGWLYAYIYTQMSAPSTVSTDVEVVCYICGADNFELFVPSYNVMQTGDNPTPVVKEKSGKSETVTDVPAAAAAAAPKKVPTQAKIYTESPAGALEMPQYEPEKAGVFPELKDGLRPHRRKHTDLDVLLGRAHLWGSFTYTSAQGFINDYALNWKDVKGHIGALAKCFTLFRGGLKLVVTIETVFQAEVYVSFRPKGVEKITTLEQLYKYGVVSFSTEQTHQVVLKLPWYQAIGANSLFSDRDAIFGYITLAATTSGTLKIHYAVAFDRDSKFYTPRGCPMDKFFQPATKSAAHRYARSLPDTMHDVPIDSEGKMDVHDPTKGYAPDDFPKDFMRSSVHRKGMYDKPKKEHGKKVPGKDGVPMFSGSKDDLDLPKTKFEVAAKRIFGTAQTPQSSNVEGPHFLCRRPSRRYPIDHYFIMLEDGRKYGFESVSGGFFDAGIVVREYCEKFEIVGPATESAGVVEFLEGRYYRDYHFVKFNCEHWARLYAGYGEVSTQADKIAAFVGFASVATAAVASAAVQWPQSDSEKSNSTTSENDEIISLSDFVAMVAKWVYAEGIGNLTMSREQILYDVKNIYEDAPYTATTETLMEMAKAKYLKENDQSKKSALKSFTGMFKKDNNDMPPLEGSENETKPKKEKKGPFASLTRSMSETVKETVGDAVGESTTKIENWLKTTLFPSLESQGAKIAKKVMNVMIDVAQAACLLHVAINYPIPGVVGPIAAAASLGAARGITRMLLTLTRERVQGEDEDDPDVTEDMATLVYEAITKVVPSDMEPQMAKEGFIEKIKNMNILASGVKNVVTLGSWLAKAAKACVDYIMPTKKGKAVRYLTKHESSIEMVRQIWLKTKDDPSCLKDDQLDVLCGVTIKLWKNAVDARDFVKDRFLVIHLEKAYTMFKTEVTKRKMRGDGLPRVEPVVIWLHGPKGCGKSVSSCAIASYICKKMGVDLRKSIYNKPVSAKYYDGYKQQPVMIMDDVGQNTSATSTDFDDFCQIVSTAPLRLNMAELNEKGIQFKTPIIIATSNIASPTPAGIADTSAIERRIKDNRYYVCPTKEFALSGGTSLSDVRQTPMLDGVKANREGKLKKLECVEFHPGLDKNSLEKPWTMKQVIDHAMAQLDRKTQVHKDMLEMWFDTIGLPQEPQMKDKKNNNVKPIKISTKKKDLEKICNDLEISVGQPRKMVPTWLRVLTGIGIAASIASGVLGVGAAVWAMTAPKKKNPQGAYNVTPVHNSVIRVPAKVPVAEQSVTDIATVVRKHLVQVGYVKSDRIQYKVQGIMVGGLRVLVPRHFLAQCSGRPIVVYSRNIEFQYEWADLVVNEIQWLGEETDAALVTLPTGGVQPYSDISDHFVSEDDVEKFEGTAAMLVTRGPYGDTMIPEEKLEFCAKTSYGVEVQYNPAGVYIGKAVTLDGMCGGGLVSASNKMKNPILGIHVAGNGYMATTQVVTKEILKVQQPQSRIISVKDGPMMGMSNKTQFKLSPWARFFKSGKIPAALTPHAATEQDIFAMAVAKYNHSIQSAPSDWHKFENVFARWFSEKVGVTSGQLSIDEAINGVEGLDGINMKTSPGWPWVRMMQRKKDLIKWDGEKWTATDVFVEAVKYHHSEVEESDPEGFVTLDAYDVFNPEFEPPIKYVTYYKDELRPVEKVQSGKTRIIEAAPVHHVVAFRQVFGKAMALLHQSMVSQSGFAPGSDIEAFAGLITARMRQYRHLFDVDYQGFDGSLQPFVMNSAMRVLGVIGSVDMYTATRWARLLVRTEHLFAGQQFSVFGSMPSGSPATTIINTISNMMMSYYALWKVTKEPLDVVLHTNFVMSYGDDLVVMAGHDIVAERFWMWVEVQRGVFSAVATSPDKSGPPKPTPLENIVFLKRKFRNVRGVWRACLDQKSIEALLEWQHESETYPERVRNAFRYAAMWGPGVYGAYMARIGCACIVAPVQGITILPYSEWERILGPI